MLFVLYLPSGDEHYHCSDIKYRILGSFSKYRISVIYSSVGSLMCFLYSHQVMSTIITRSFGKCRWYDPGIWYQILHSCIMWQISGGWKSNVGSLMCFLCYYRRSTDLLVLKLHYRWWINITLAGISENSLPFWFLIWIISENFMIFSFKFFGQILIIFCYCKSCNQT